MEYAEKLIKEQDFTLPNVENANEPVLDGLTCRWKPVPSQKGLILCLMIKARQDEKAVYEQILNELKRLFPEGIEEHNPARPEHSSYQSVFKSMILESRLQMRTLSFAFLKRLIELFPAWFVFNLKLPIPQIRNYVHQTPEHSDYRKFDGLLRMVIDTEKSKAESIKSFLSQLHAQGKVHYGIHETTHSLMTCFVESLNPGDHLHFVDAADGGYSIAASRMKQQMASSQT
jgi:hypothetical protein